MIDWLAIGYRVHRQAHLADCVVRTVGEARRRTILETAPPAGGPHLAQLPHEEREFVARAALRNVGGELERRTEHRQVGERLAIGPKDEGQRRGREAKRT